MNESEAFQLILFCGKSKRFVEMLCITTESLKPWDRKPCTLAYRLALLDVFGCYQII